MISNLFVSGCYQFWESHENPFHSVTSIGTCKHKCDSEHIGRYFGYRKKNQSVSKVNVIFIGNPSL